MEGAWKEHMNLAGLAVVMPKSWNPASSMHKVHTSTSTYCMYACKYVVAAASADRNIRFSFGYTDKARTKAAKLQFCCTCICICDGEAESICPFWD